MSHGGRSRTEVTTTPTPIDHPFTDVSVTVRRGQTDTMPSCPWRVYEAEDGSVLTGEIEAYGRAQAPSPRRRTRPHLQRKGDHAAPAPRAEDASRPAHLRACRVILSIGGNLGDVPVTLMATVEALSYMKASRSRTSPSTCAPGCPRPGQAPQPDY